MPNYRHSLLTYSIRFFLQCQTVGVGKWDYLPSHQCFWAVSTHHRIGKHNAFDGQGTLSPPPPSPSPPPPTPSPHSSHSFIHLPIHRFCPNYRIYGQIHSPLPFKKLFNLFCPAVELICQSFLTMALSALLLLLPLLLNVQKIPDESVQLDMNAVYSAISSMDQWKNPRNSLESLDFLTTPQKALAKMHWELETIQKEKPMAPPQFDLGLFSEALEAMVEMDEEAKEVRLRKDKLNEWAGVEQKRAVEEEANGKEKEKPREESAGTVPEVTVNENGNIEVKNGAGGEGKMEVKRRKDENGNEEVVVTFVKASETEGPTKVEKNETKTAEEKPKEEEQNKENMEEGPKTDNADKEKSVPKAIPSFLILSAEKETDKKRENKEEMHMENVNENDRTANESLFEIVERPKNERDFGGRWFASPFFSGGGQSPVGSLFNLFFGRKKRETVVREHVQRTEDGRTIRTIEKLTTLGKPGTEIKTKVVDFAMSVDKDGEKQPQAKGEGGNDWTTKQSDEKESSSKRESDTAKEEEVGEEQQKERKAEIMQYLYQTMANAEGPKKWEKLVYVWYSEMLYWTSKWIETLENRVAGVKPELVQQFIFSNTGLAAYKELKDEVEKCEAKLAKLKEWVGEYFK